MVDELSAIYHICAQPKLKNAAAPASSAPGSNSRIKAAGSTTAEARNSRGLGCDGVNEFSSYNITLPWLIGRQAQGVWKSSGANSCRLRRQVRNSCAVFAETYAVFWMPI